MVNGIESGICHLIDEIPYSADILADADNLVFHSYPIE
jgi:hypothetical protein